MALAALERGQAERVREALRIDGLAARDRGLALELALGVERRRITLDCALIACTTRGELPRDPFVHTALRLGGYQLLYMPRVAVHAAVHTTVELLRQVRGFTNAMLRRLAACVQQRAADPQRPRSELALPDGAQGPRCLALPVDWLPDPEAAPAAWLGAVFGLPEPLVAGWLRHHGLSTTRAMCEAAVAAPGVTLRVNRRQTDAPGLVAALAAEGVAAHALDAHLVRLRSVEGRSPFDTAAHRDGLFAVQDPTAFAAAQALAPTAGETILDLCAAPGGKATALAELCTNGGRVFAFDIDRDRLALVEEATARLRLRDTLTVIDDLTKAPPQCDAVLADVPCSNTGVLARRVEVRRRLRPGTIAAMAGPQRELLQLAMQRVRPGGRVVYSTCSVEPEENRGVVDAVMAAAPGVRLEREQLTLPVAQLHDGGYFAVLRRS
jgi:16S rRNA (cytosine967-C5)-methyltransferase